MNSEALPLWTNNYKLSNYVDSLNLPGEGNNVMYWPDDYDRHVAAANVESSLRRSNNRWAQSIIYTIDGHTREIQSADLFGVDESLRKCHSEYGHASFSDE